MDRYTSQTKLFREGASFEKQEDFNARSVMAGTSESHLESCGIPLDYPSEGMYATSCEEHHVLVVGDTGCGKTRRLILPAIRLMGRTGRSMVVSDPKGELYKKTSLGLAQRGYDVKILNMRNPRRGQKWNPFTVVERLYNDGENYKAQLMIEDILNMMKAGVHCDRDVFWENIASQFLTAIALSFAEYGNPGDLSFGSIARAESEIMEWIRSPYSSQERFISFVEGQDQCSAIAGDFRTVLEAGTGDSNKVLESISTVSHTMASMFIKNDAMKSMMSGSDFDVKDIGRHPTAVFLVLPDDSDAMYPLATLFVSQVYSQLVDLAFENGGKLPNPVDFVLDEFANFTKLPNFRSMLTASRSRGMRFFLVVQDVDQLEAQYSENDAAVIRSNCHDWVFMGCRNLEFLRMLSSLSGIYRNRYTGETGPLVDLNDLLTLQQGEAIVWRRGRFPKRCWLPDCSEVDFGDENISENDFPPMDETSENAPISFINIISTWENNRIQFVEENDSDKDESISDWIRDIVDNTSDPDECLF